MSTALLTITRAMSSPQTPITTRRESANSTPSSSRDAASPASLTPRSKVKAMLAAIDNDDSSEADDDNHKGNADASTSGIIHTVSTSSNTKSYIDQEVGEPKGSDIEHENVMSRPRGKLARKMQVENGAQTGHLGNDYAWDEDNAYDRIKRQLKEQQGSAPMASVEKWSHSDELGGRQDGIDRHTSAPPSQQSQSNSPARSAKPNYRSLQKSMSPQPHDSDSDLPEDPHSNPRILALVEQKRREREAKEAEAALNRKQRQDRLKELAKSKADMDESNDVDSESAVEKRLTQQVRPTRKASKKALEEMNRETQRISRNMQLTHEARTKKKITKQSLFARFNYKPAGSAADEIVTSGTGSHSSSNLVSDSDIRYSTAPSSPPLIGNAIEQPDEKARESYGEVLAPDNETTWPIDDQDLPSYNQVLAEKPKEPMSFAENDNRQSDPDVVKVDKGKGKAKAVEPKPSMKMKRDNGISRRVQIRLPIPSKRQDDSDSDLEIIPTSKAKAALLSHVYHEKEAQSRPLHAQRTLARLNVQEDKTNKIKDSVTFPEMQAQLQRNARQQAIKERVQRLEELAKKGIFLPTAEERAREDATIEEMIEKARRETEEMSKREKAAAKKAGNQGFAKDLLDSDGDDEEDAEWSGEDEDVEYSGSEEEVESDEEAEVEDDQEHEDGGNQGDSHENDHPDKQDSNLISTELLEQTISERGTPPVTQDPDYKKSETMNALIRSGNEEQELVMSAVEVENPFAAKSPLIAGFPGAGGISLGLTQIFAGTMADEQTQMANGGTGSLVQNNDSLDFLRQLPAISLPCIDQGLDQAMQDVVKDSQPLQSRTDSNLGVEHATRSQADLPNSQSNSQHEKSEDPLYLHYPSPTQLSEFPDPTQDVGFAALKPFTPRFVQSPQSTVDTVLLEKDLWSAVQRGTGPMVREDGESEQIRASDGEGGLGISANVFDVMRKAAKEPQSHEQFDKKKSKAKEMVEEQAEESEDEYAGLGGASEDDSEDDEEDVEMKDMLDDREQDIDEADLAALMADKDRADDKKQIEKIYRDVTTGALRRKRGTDLDLSDSDYDEEARRRQKRRKEMKLRKALLADEHVEKIATNPKKSAFFQSIEDRDKAEEIDFLEELDHEVLVPDSQEDNWKRDTRSVIEPNSPSKKNKRKPTAEDSGDEENRPPPNLRRSTKSKKPTTTDDIRECLAALIAPPNATIVPDMGDNSEDDEEAEEEIDSSDPIDHNNNKPHNPFTGPQHKTRSSKTKVIDRLALLRTHNTTSTITTRLAFQDSTTSNNPGFRVPALLRRATTSHLISDGDVANNNSGGGAVVGVRNKEESSTTMIKRPGNKKSCSINWYHAREQQRKAIEERGKKERDGRILKIGRERRGALFGGLFGDGKFE